MLHQVYHMLMVTSVILEGVAASFISSIIDSLLAAVLESHERARISTMVYVLLLLFTLPFGWMAGQLSAVDQSLPVVLTI